MIPGFVRHLFFVKTGNKYRRRHDWIQEKHSRTILRQDCCSSTMSSCMCVMILVFLPSWRLLCSWGYFVLPTVCKACLSKMYTKHWKCRRKKKSTMKGKRVWCRREWRREELLHGLLVFKYSRRPFTLKWKILVRQWRAETTSGMRDKFIFLLKRWWKNGKENLVSVLSFILLSAYLLLPTLPLPSSANDTGSLFERKTTFQRKKNEVTTTKLWRLPWNLESVIFPLNVKGCNHGRKESWSSWNETLVVGHVDDDGFPFFSTSILLMSMTILIFHFFFGYRLVMQLNQASLERIYDKKKERKWKKTLLDQLKKQIIIIIISTTSLVLVSFSLLTWKVVKNQMKKECNHHDDDRIFSLLWKLLKSLTNSV